MASSLPTPSPSNRRPTPAFDVMWHGNPKFKEWAVAKNPQIYNRRPSAREAMLQQWSELAMDVRTASAAQRLTTEAEQRAARSLDESLASASTTSEESIVQPHRTLLLMFRLLSIHHLRLEVRTQEWVQRRYPRRVKDCKLECHRISATICDVVVLVSMTYTILRRRPHQVEYQWT